LVERIGAWGRRASGIFVVAALALAACGGKTVSPSAPVEPIPVVAAPARPRVVIVSIDGLRGDVVARANAPVLKGLAARGAYTWTAQTNMPAITLPSHASMLSGFLPSAHGITWNDYDPSKGPIQVPTVFTVARAAGLRTVLVAGKEKFKQLDQPGTISDFEMCGGTDDEVGNRAIGIALAGAFDLMFVHLPQTDLTGHAQGWLSSAYMSAVAGADRVVGSLVAALPENTTLIVTADHGGHDYTHGANVPTDINIPWIAVGPRVAPHALAGGVNTTDTAATALWVLGLRPAAGATGRPVAEALQSASATTVARLH
jgi:arylsulfatase A-like enzyme